MKLIISKKPTCYLPSALFGAGEAQKTIRLIFMTQCGFNLVKIDLRAKLKRPFNTLQWPCGTNVNTNSHQIHKLFLSHFKKTFVLTFLENFFNGFG